MDVGTGTNHILDFKIPCGADGKSVNILGSYDTADALKAAVPVGNAGDGYLVEGNLYVWSATENAWIDVGEIKGPKGDKGDQGEAGPAGPQKISAAYLVTYNDGTNPNGIEVAADQRLPITRKELDLDSICDLDANANTFQFSKIGYYKVTFVANAYANTDDVDTDIVSVGLRLVGTDNIYIGDSAWSHDIETTKVVAQGIISVDNIVNPYEFVNLSKNSIYLSSPNLTNLNTKSYFATTLLSVTIEYLGI